MVFILLCLLPLWAFLPFLVSGFLFQWLGGIGIVIGIILGAWFYGAGVVMLPFDSGFFKLEFWDI